jgi:hypothetical protein
LFGVVLGLGQKRLFGERVVGEGMRGGGGWMWLVKRRAAGGVGE